MPGTIPYSKEAFEKAASEVDNFGSLPTDKELLKTYSLYKQHNYGDLDENVPRPGTLNMRGQAKYNAWQERAGTSKEAAGQEYINHVEALKAKYGVKA